MGGKAEVVVYNHGFEAQTSQVGSPLLAGMRTRGYSVKFTGENRA
jgi:hypothetical protein